MSKEIDERVVEMRFDNSHFEKNVQTSMSTLDKFNEKLKFKNAGKSFDQIDKAAKKTDLSPLAKSADKVGLRFNAMYTVADQAFRNITNSAMAAGKRIISALTIDPIKTGLQEYETKMNAIQVIQANTRGKNTMEEITAALEELNVYADKTIYNFAQMTSNVGKFTAQGYEVSEAANAVKGLANLAAASGASAEDMARATYQMSQALGGTIRMIDWNSLRNANMATVDLKNTLMDLARVNGIAIDDMIAKHGTFEQTLQEGWLSGSMFTEAMNIYSGIYSEAELKAKGFTDAQIENFMSLAAMAESAATEVKTFTQLFDVLKETAQSGWTQTWELIFGDFNTAKAMFTELQVYFGDIINAFSDARNMLFGGALNLKNPWTKIMEKLEASSIGKIVNTFDKVSSSVKNANDKLEYFQKVVNDVWRGDYKNSDTGRFELLEAAGYNHKVVQDLVNKGYNYKLTIEDIEESHKKFGLTLDGNAESLDSAGDAAENAAIKFNEITDAQLEQAGLTKDEIKLYRDLAEEAERTGVTMLHLVNEMSENDGRTMLIDSIKNAWSGLVTVITAVRDAWVDVFPPMTVVQLYNIIKGIRDFSEYLVVHEETAENLTRTFRGLFAILDIILTVVSLPMKIAFKALTQLLGVLDIDILSVTAVIGDAIVGFRDFIDASLDFTKVFEKIAPAIRIGIDAIVEWFSQIADGFQNGFSDIPGNIISGFKQGIWSGLKSVGDVVVQFGQMIIDKICEVLGIHSPSTVFFAIGGFIVAGLLLGIKTFAPEVWTTIKDMGLKCIEVIKQIDFGAVISALVSAGATVALLKIADAFQNFSGVFEGVGDMLEDFGKGVKRFLGGIGAKFRAEAIKEIAIAILILVGAIYVLTKLDPMAVASSLLVIGSLVIMLQYLSKNSGMFDKTQAANLAHVVGALIGISASILIFAYAMDKLAGLNIEDNWPSILGGLAAAVVSLGSVLIAYGVFVKGKAAANIDKAGITILKIAGTMLIMAFVIKIISGIDDDALLKGGLVITAFSAIVVGLIAATKLAGNKINSASALISGVGTAMALMAVACKIIGTMSWTEMGKAAVGIVVFGAIVTGLIAVTKLATDKDVSKAGKLISSVGIAMILMALTGKILATMSWGDMAKALVGVAALGGIVTGLIAATNLATDKELKKVGFMVLTLSIAVGILGLIAMVLSMMDVGALVKGVGAVAVLGLIMTAMIKATANVQKCMGNLIVMTIAIALMATAVATLSLIDTTKLLASAGSMALVMGMFALMIQTTSKINTAGAVKALIGLTVMLGLFVGLALILNVIPMDNISKNKDAIGMLTIVMAAMSILLVITAAVGAIYAASGAMAMLGLVGMLAILAEFALFAWAINAIPMDTIADKKDALTILTAVMVAMSLVLIATAAAGAIYAVTAGLAMLGLVGMLAILAEFALFAWAINAIPMDTIADKKDALYILIDVMTILSDLLVKIAIVGPLAVIGVTAMGGLMALIAALGVFAVGVGALLEKFPSLKTFLDTGIPVLEQLAHAVGSIISKFVGGLFSELPNIGKSLSSFMNEAKVFFDGIKMVDGNTLKSVGILTGIFAALTATEFVSGITSFIKEKIFGESQFENFGNSLVSLADCIAKFASATKNFTDKELDRVTLVADILKALTEAADTIPNSGGKIAEWFGDNDLGDFISMLEDSLEGIGSLLSTISDADIDKSTVNKIELVCDVISSMTEAAKELPNTGGVSGFLAGNNDIDDFIKMLGGCVEDLNLFIEGANNIDEGSMTKVHQVIDMLTNVTTIASNLNVTANIATFGSGMNSFATNFRKFCEKMSDLDSVDLNFAIVRLQSFVDFCTSADATTISNISNLGMALKDIAIDGYNKFLEVFTKEESTSGAEKAISSFISTTATNVKTDKNKKKFQKIGAYLVEGLAEGIRDGKNDVVSAAVAVVKAAETAARTEAQINSPSKKFMTIGRYLVEGFANGISDNAKLPKQSMKELTDDLLKYTQDELEINSPSLVYKDSVGKWICEGIAKGILEDTSAEDAMKIKLANIFSAYEEYRTNLPEGATPVAFDKILYDNGIRSTRTWTDEAKANGKSYAEYMYDLSAVYFADGFDGAEQAADKAATSIDKQFSKAIDTIEDKIKSSNLTYKAQKLLTFDKDKKIELEQNYLLDQIDLKMQLIDEYESKIKEYQLRTNTLEDSYILGIREDILGLKEQIAEHEESLSTVAGDIASEKAQEIRDNYQTTFDRIAKDMEMLDSTYENWVLSYPDAKQSVKHSRLFDHLDSELKFLKEKEETYKKMVNEIAAVAGTESEEYKAAYTEWVRARADRFNKEEEISNTHEQHLKDLEDAEDRVRESEYALWQAKNQNASEQEQLARELKYLEECLIDTEEESAKLHEEYLKLVEKEGETSELTKDALADWNESSAEEAELRQAIADNKQSALDAAEEANDRLRESTYELYLAENEDASDHEKLTRELAYIEESIVDAREDVTKATEAYNEALKDANATEAERANLLADLNEKKAIVADLENDKKATEKNILALAEERRDIISDTAKLQYDIWEKTEGRDAKDAEKEAKQLEYLNQQMLVQTQVTNEALAEYNEAVKTHGEDSIEAARAYKTYLDELYACASLKDQILDLEEAAADRQKRLRDKQDLSQDEYEDYLKRYEKYYLANGMTREDLEKDAKLVSGYDPTKVIDDASNKTQTAMVGMVQDCATKLSDNRQLWVDTGTSLMEGFLEGFSGKDGLLQTTVNSSIGYQGMVDGLGKSSYADSLATRTTEEMSGIQATITNMIQTCASGLQNTRASWVRTGTYLANGLVKGITNRREYLKKNTMDVLQDTLNTLRDTYNAWYEMGAYLLGATVQAVKDQRSYVINTMVEIAIAMAAGAAAALGIHSPSREFAAIGEYSILGLVEGLDRNAALARIAAAKVGTDTVESFRDAFNNISYALNDPVYVDVLREHLNILYEEFKANSRDTKGLVYTYIAQAIEAALTGRSVEDWLEESDYGAIELEPIIRPVLDLSNIRTGSATLNAMVSNSQAMAISNSRVAREHSGENQNGNDSSTNTGNTYQFTQNNYSPTALSATEIYRQTRNQFAILKEVTSS